jgi:hydroxyacylglutathione hydrolase
MLINKITIGNFKANCYIISCEETNKGVVIDPGGNVREIISYINKTKITLEYIFNTHFHADHTGGNNKLKKISKAKLVIHRMDLPYLRRIISGDKIWRNMFLCAG